MFFQIKSLIRNNHESVVMVISHSKLKFKVIDGNF